MFWRGHNKEHVLGEHASKITFLECVQNDYVQKRSKEEFVIHGYCVMGNHFHELSAITGSREAYSEHMRASHGRFGLIFNKRHKRLGKVAHDRPRTLVIENKEHEMRVLFYIDANPVRARLTKHPTDIKWREFSSCRFYAYGETGKHTQMLTPPDWYLALGDTPKKRQAAYRRLLDRYLREHRLIRDPKMTHGLFIGGALWIREKKDAYLAARKARKACDAMPSQAQAPPV